MKALSLLIKPASGACDLRCRYCFYADVAHARAVHHHGMMTEETLEIIVQKALSEATEAVTFGFQGGEPTLVGLEFFEKLVLFQRRYNLNGVRVANALQTNGLHIDEAFAAFLAREGFLVGISIDGPGEVHDLLRIDAASEGSFARAMKAAALLTRYKAEFNILSVVTRAMARHPDAVYGFYKKRGFRYVQFIACLDGLDEAPGGHPHSLSAGDYGAFLMRVFDLWYEDWRNGHYVSIRAFDNYVGMLLGHPPENCAMNGVCGSYPLIEADGSVYPCDFYALDAHRIGDVRRDSFAEMLGSDASQAFMAPSRVPDAACAACPHMALCRGGCRRERETGDGRLGLNRFCEAYKAFFAHAEAGLRAVAHDIARRHASGRRF